MKTREKKIKKKSTPGNSVHLVLIYNKFQTAALQKQVRGRLWKRNRTTSELQFTSRFTVRDKNKTMINFEKEYKNSMQTN